MTKSRGFEAWMTSSAVAACNTVAVVALAVSVLATLARRGRQPQPGSL